MSKLYRTLSEWCRLDSIEILDPDGWRTPEFNHITSFDSLLNLYMTKEEYNSRIVFCTIQGAINSH